MKLKNQFRALDDDELDFLDSIDETKRQKEAEKRKETALELETFRKQQAEAEKLLLTTATNGPALDTEAPPKTTWQTKKRRRKDDDKSAPKIRKMSTGGESSPPTTEAPPAEPTEVAATTPAPVATDTPSAPAGGGSLKPDTAAPGASLGLGAYASDSD
jgi:hypothetical protein